MAKKKTPKASEKALDGQHPRRTLTRERVIKTAIQFADEHGIDALSMRKLGQLLGVEAMSLYNHVANKDEILDGIVDAIAGDFKAPKPGGDWRTAMRRRAVAAHKVLVRHPWATQLIVSRANVGPLMLRYVDATIGCLIEAGFTYPKADHAWNAIDSYVYGFTLQKLNFPFKPNEYAQVAQSFLELIPADQYPYLNGMSQQIISGDHDGVHELQFGLDLILEGLDALRGPA